MVIDGREAELKKGLEILGKLTSGKVYLGMNGRDKELPEGLRGDLPAEKVWFSGPHPAGNVGVQIHHIAPVRSGDVVWTLGLQELMTLGALFTKGIFDATRVVSVGGNMVDNPAYVRTKMGCAIEDILKHFELSDLEKTRIISGDVLSGVKVDKENFLGVFDDQISLIQEGDYYEPFGWLIPQKMRPSLSRTYPNFLFPNVAFEADSNTHGERRAFVVSGQYEKVLPMDIYPQQLMKAILTNDFEKMEGLGIRELVEEDVALCEFVCTSKMPLQKILREGLDEVQAQG
jgi:Na+-transporting NADH:ubiquinone oxidoreductase subunit A